MAELGEMKRSSVLRRERSSRARGEEKHYEL